MSIVLRKQCAYQELLVEPQLHYHILLCIIIYIYVLQYWIVLGDFCLTEHNVVLFMQRLCQRILSILPHRSTFEGISGSLRCHTILGGKNNIKRLFYPVVYLAVLSDFKFKTGCNKNTTLKRGQAPRLVEVRICLKRRWRRTW